MAQEVHSATEFNACIILYTQIRSCLKKAGLCDKLAVLQSVLQSEHKDTGRSTHTYLLGMWCTNYLKELSSFL